MDNTFDLDYFLSLAPNWQNKAFYFPTINSTNHEARLRLQSQPREMLFVTDKQTAGKGRLNRTWEAPFGTGLLCSLTLPLAPLPLDRAYLHTASLALAVQQAVEKLANVRLDLKWPNDLLRQNLKCGGILAELESDWLILGFGLNTSLTQFDLSQANLQTKATNIIPEDITIEREKLLAAILNNLANYRARLALNPDDVWHEWASSLVTIGQNVRVSTIADKSEFEGKAVRVDQSGCLWIEQTDRKLLAVQAGDVSIRLADGRYA